MEIEPLTFEVGYGLIPLVDSGKAELLNKIKAIRRQLAHELGFVIPPVHIKDNLQLRPHEYSFLMRGIEVGKGEVMMGPYLAVSSAKGEPIEGVPTKEPAFGLPAYWISEKEMEKAQVRGYMVVDPATVIATHLTEMIKAHAWELLTRTEVQNFLKERVAINDKVTILETLLDYSASSKDPEILTEYVRQSLSRFITKQYVSAGGDMKVMTLDPRFEKELSQAIEASGVISPDMVGKLIRAIENTLKDTLKGACPVILCSAHVRRFLRKITERLVPSLIILSNAEISPPVTISITGGLRYED